MTQQPRNEKLVINAQEVAKAARLELSPEESAELSRLLTKIYQRLDLLRDIQLTDEEPLR